MTEFPEHIYYSREHDNFYSWDGQGMGEEFFQEWKVFRHQFPQTKEEVEPDPWTQQGLANFSKYMDCQ